MVESASADDAPPATGSAEAAARGAAGAHHEPVDREAERAARLVVLVAERLVKVDVVVLAQPVELHGRLAEEVVRLHHVPVLDAQRRARRSAKSAQLAVELDRLVPARVERREARLECPLDLLRLARRATDPQLDVRVGLAGPVRAEQILAALEVDAQDAVAAEARLALELLPRRRHLAARGLHTTLNVSVPCAGTSPFGASTATPSNSSVSVSRRSPRPTQTSPSGSSLENRS